MELGELLGSSMSETEYLHHGGSPYPLQMSRRSIWLAKSSRWDASESIIGIHTSHHWFLCVVPVDSFENVGVPLGKSAGLQSGNTLRHIAGHWQIAISLTPTAPRVSRISWKESGRVRGRSVSFGEHAGAASMTAATAAKSRQCEVTYGC